MRICTFGAVPNGADWLERLRAEAPRIPIETIDAQDAIGALKIATRRFAGDDLVLIRSDTAQPPFWLARLRRVLDLPDVLVASPLDNVEPARSSLPPGESSNADPEAIDASIHRYGRREAMQWPTFSTLLSAWRGAALQTLDIAHIRGSTIPASFAPLRAMLVGDLYVADPARVHCAVRNRPNPATIRCNRPRSANCVKRCRSR